MSSAKTLSESSFCHKRRRPSCRRPTSSEDHHPAQAELVGVRHPGCPGSEWGKAESGLDLDDSQGGGIRSSPETARRRTARNDSTQCCGRGRRRKARPVRAHVPNEGGRPVPVPSVPCQDPSRQDAGRCQVPRHEDDAGRTCDSLTAGDEVVRQRSAQPCHELRLRRGLGAVCWTQRDSKAFLPHGVQLPHPTATHRSCGLGSTP